MHKKGLTTVYCRSRHVFVFFIFICFTDDYLQLGMSTTSDVMARARPGYRGLGSAFAAQGFTNHKPKPWAKLRHGLGSASA